MKAILIGASGLVGSQLLQILLGHKAVQEVRAIVRTPVDVEHEKLTQVTIDFTELDTFKSAMDVGDVVFCCVGTTMNKVQSDKVAYRKVDYDIPFYAAQFAKESNCDHFSMISAIDANKDSKNFYLQLKGEVEAALKTLDLPSVAIFQPSLLLGERKEFRLGERIGGFLFRGIAFILPSKYHPIRDKQLAQGMLKRAIEKSPGTHIYQYKEIIKKL